jgi:FkbM family methyltransferase
MTRGHADPGIRLSPHLESLTPEDAARVAMTVSCGDSDFIPKVSGAGDIRTINDTRVQVMHNGVVIEVGCYYGPWMTEIIRCLRGHHEPQEEAAFHAVLERLQRDADGEPRSIVELGSFWAYYSLWFLSVFPAAHVVAMEPDPAYLEVGRRNFALNGRQATFVHAAVGPRDLDTLPFRAESDGVEYSVPVHSLGSLMDATGVKKADVVLADIQGAETQLLHDAREVFSAGRVRFVVISTHHHSISGDPLTHQNALGYLSDLGAYIVGEHSIGESFSGDGLIVASFDQQDRDLELVVSRARQRESLFGELEYDLAREMAQTARLRHDIQQLTEDLTSTEAECSALRRELAAVQMTKLWRWSRGARKVYGRLHR